MSDAPEFAVRDQRLLTDGSSVVVRPNWNADGQSIVYEQKTADGSQLFQVGRSGSQGIPLQLCNEGATRVQGRAAFFGQDDFAYVSNRGGSLAIWRCDLARQRVSALTSPADGASDYGPSAPGPEVGGFLFFRIPKGTPVPRVHRARVNEPQMAIAMSAQMGDQPWFVPKGREFIFHSDRDGGQAVYRQSLDPQSAARLVGESGAGTPYMTPFPSPDGRYVVHTRCVDGVQQLFVMRIDGTRLQQLTFAAESAMFPAWSPVGSRLVYVSGDPTSKSPTGRLATLEIERLVP